MVGFVLFVDSRHAGDEYTTSRYFALGSAQISEFRYLLLGSNLQLALSFHFVFGLVCVKNSICEDKKGFCVMKRKVTGRFCR